MPNTPTGIKNTSLEDIALPPPYRGVLPAGQMAIVADSVTGAQGALGGSPTAALGPQPYLTKLLQFVSLPTGTALSMHGAPNVPETIAATVPTLSNFVNTSRLDLAGGCGPTAALANGLFIGQRKQLFQLSATGAATVSVVPATMAESKSFVKLAAIGAYAELEWTQNGWSVIALGGPTGSAASFG